jgi:hypothetical protein
MFFLSFMLLEYWSNGYFRISKAKFRPPSLLLRPCPPAGKGEAVGLEDIGWQEYQLGALPQPVGSLASRASESNDRVKRHVCPIGMLR